NNLAMLQNSWLDWVRKGSPAISSDTPALVAVKGTASDRLSRTDGAKSKRGREAASDTASEARAAAEGPIVYDRRGVTADDDLAADKPAEDSWRAPRDGASEVAAGRGSAAARTSAGVAEGTSPHQATRPQEIQRPGQVILEWSRPFQAADEDRGIR